MSKKIKKITILFIIAVFAVLPVYAKQDKISAEYLKNKKHFAILNPLVENIAEKSIKKSLKKECNGDIDVKFEGYTLASMKKGVFKTLNIKGKDLLIEGIEIPLMEIKSLTDYNRIDYKQNPPVIKSDMEYAYHLELSEKSINEALDKKDYQKTIQRINNIAYPLFMLYDVNVKIRNNKVYIIMDYNFPISKLAKNRSFVVSTGFKINGEKIKAYNVAIDKAYGNLSVEKITNLINLLDPLSYTLSVMNKKKCNARIENVKIVDNIIQIDGKIFVKGD